MTQADNLHVITFCVNTGKASYLDIEILVTLTSSLKQIQFFADQSLAALSITLASLPPDRANVGNRDEERGHCGIRYAVLVDFAKIVQISHACSQAIRSYRTRESPTVPVNSVLHSCSPCCSKSPTPSISMLEQCAVGLMVVGLSSILDPNSLTDSTPLAWRHQAIADRTVVNARGPLPRTLRERGCARRAREEA